MEGVVKRPPKDYNRGMKKLPVGIQTFEKLINGNYLYVDKTPEIYKLLESGGQYFFLSRPRRFGKSLLLSTLKELFNGNKELFKELWIYDKIEWKRNPVIHLDFTTFAYDSDELLKKSLEQMLEKIANEYGIQLNSVNYKTRFGELIEKLSAKGKVAILIDEYDKPIIDKIDNPVIAKQNREVIKEFYGVLKGADAFIEFVLLTGVSKFSRVSIFSGLNNLLDITMHDRYSTLLGYTHEEVLDYFSGYLDAMAEEETRSGSGGDKEDAKNELLIDIKKWYDGYSWDGRNFVYNPFSVLTFFENRRFGNYWFETGTPSFLIKLMKEYDIDVTQLERYRAAESIFESFDLGRMHVISLLFQTGYLTVKELEPAGRRQRFYILSYPNLEVKESFLEHLLGELSSRFADEVSVAVFEMKKALLEKRLDDFFLRAKSIFGGISYDMFVQDREGYYQTVVYLTLMLIGLNVKTEVETNLGRIDTVIETEKYIYVMEFKLGLADDALMQVEEKKYYQGFLNSGKEVILVGVGFDPEQRNIKEYRIKKV